MMMIEARGPAGLITGAIQPGDHRFVNAKRAGGPPRSVDEQWMTGGRTKKFWGQPGLSGDNPVNPKNTP
jgi:hypothetical protein